MCAVGLSPDDGNEYFNILVETNSFMKYITFVIHFLLTSHSNELLRLIVKIHFEKSILANLVSMNETTSCILFHAEMHPMAADNARAKMFATARLQHVQMSFSSSLSEAGASMNPIT